MIRIIFRTTLSILLLVLASILGVSGECTCYNEDLNSFIYTYNDTRNCICDGSLFSSGLMSLNDLEFQKLTVKNFQIENLTSEDFTRLRGSSLVDITMTNFFELRRIDQTVFNKFVKLKSLFISNAPKLNSVFLDILQYDRRSNLTYLSITKSGLIEAPTIRMESQLFNLIDFEANSIRTIQTNNIAAKSSQLILNYNDIASIKKWAFNNSQISEIRLRGNRNLKILTAEAFYGLRSLTLLDLSETSIVSIPASQLPELEILIMEETYTLKTIPTIYEFPVPEFVLALTLNIRKTRYRELKKRKPVGKKSRPDHVDENLKDLTQAILTFSFHCCAFQLPKLHDPEKYAMQESLRSSYCNSSNLEGNSANIANESEEEWYDSDVAQPILGKALSLNCKNYNFKKRVIACLPAPNAFNPCEDIMGYTWLRICVWLIGLISLFGNICVLTVLLSRRWELNVPNFLITNLAFSDLCTACFLLMLATEDYVSKGYYFNYAFDWQMGVFMIPVGSISYPTNQLGLVDQLFTFWLSNYGSHMGIGCKVAGFLTVFSNQLSIFFLTLLTIERWFAIKRALYLNELTFQRTIYIACFGWVYAITMATLPLLGVSNYSTTSLCLPMEIRQNHDMIYVIFLLSMATAAFCTICVCYYQIYFSIDSETRHKDGEYVLARKMIVLVGTNFLCWAPITFFATTAALGFPLINITRSKILLVFFYPLNSCTNPFFYAILTTNFKKDLVSLLAKSGICNKTAHKYRVVYSRESSEKTILKPVTSHTTL